MERCPLLEGCIFFNEQMKNMPATTDMLKSRYCEKAYTHCGRYMIAEKLGRGQVPPDLFPNEEARANLLITEKSR